LDEVITTLPQQKRIQVFDYSKAHLVRHSCFLHAPTIIVMSDQTSEKAPPVPPRPVEGQQQQRQQQQQQQPYYPPPPNAPYQSGPPQGAPAYQHEGSQSQGWQQPQSGPGYQNSQNWQQPQAQAGGNTGPTKTSGKPSWGERLYQWSTKAGVPINKVTNKLGSEAFWPSSLDLECDKAARILKSFCSKLSAHQSVHGGWYTKK
jgi:hypothetical protein